MELVSLFSYLGFVFELAVMPGPDNIFVLSQSLSNGWRTGVYVSAGLCSGVLVHTLAAASGVTVVIYGYAPAFLTVKLLGAAYLLFLAFMAVSESPAVLPGASGGRVAGVAFALLKKGFLMNVLNPKVSLFFVALLPQFVHPTGFPIFLQMIVLGALFMLVSFLVFCSIALLGGRFSVLLNRNGFWIFTKWLKIIVFISIALKLALS